MFVMSKSQMFKNESIIISHPWGEWNSMHKLVNKRMKKAFIV